MRRPDQLDFLFRLLSTLKKEPTANSDLLKVLGVTVPQLRYAVQKLKKLGYVGTVWGGVYLLDPVFSKEQLSKDLGFRQKGVSLMKCSICNEKKERQKKVLADGSTVYVIPNTSIQWGSSIPYKNSFIEMVVCPDCVALEDTMNDPVNTSTRKCRSCGDNLPASRYFDCEKCKPDTSNINEDFLYEDASLSDVDEDFFLSLEGIRDVTFMVDNPGRIGPEEIKKIKAIIGEFDAENQSAEAGSEGSDADEIASN